MEENKVSRPRSVIRIMLVIFGMLAFGAAGFYFGSQDTFKVAKKKEKKEPVVEVKHEDNEKQEENLTINENLTEEEKMMYLTLVNLIKTTRIGASNAFGGVDLTIMKENETITNMMLSDENILDIVFKKANKDDVITRIDTGEDENTYYNNGYSSSFEYRVSLNDLKSIAEKFLNITDFNNFPKKYYYGLMAYELINEEYIGREVIGGFEGPEEYDYNVTGIKEDTSTVVVVLEQIQFLTGEDGHPDENQKEFRTFEFKFNIVNDDYQFVSVTRTK